MGTILKTELLKKYYGTGENQVRALDGIDLSIEDGELNKIATRWPAEAVA